MQVRTIALALAATSMLAACGSAKDANKANFAKAINGHFAKTCTPLRFSMGQLMAITLTKYGYPVSVASTNSAHQPEPSWSAPFDALEKAGLLTSASTEVKPGFYGPKVPGKEYSLTEAGKKALVEPGKVTFCVGHRQVEEIVQFTEPGGEMGQKISEANYTYTIADVPAWANADAIRAAFPDLASQLKPKQTARAELVLMNDGWKAEPSLF